MARNVKGGSVSPGPLPLLVGTQTRELSKDGLGLYFGYLERRGTKYDFKRLSDVLKVK